ncbi:hypothetical protein T11_6233 [Trichinella zimbabwensis]|uniref:Uncharacterized protein n=1 Tax=Trichinella zimbabwensis TaxID=268475 RepID=A0A0V1GXT8_9BILA|nr:hypothetical protein T11_6233 [Trichinella zimbabwensis]
MLSTQSTDSTILHEANYHEPAVILDCNQCKGAVDTLDKMVKIHSTERGSRQWPLVLFMNVL